MVSANSFDVVGARACGLRGAFMNRYKTPYEDTHYQPDVLVRDFADTFCDEENPILSQSVVVIDSIINYRIRQNKKNLCSKTIPNHLNIL